MKEKVKMSSIKVIKHLKNSWIKVKRSELPQQMESLVPFLSDGTGVKTPFRGVLKYRSEVFIPMDCFHLFIMYLDRPVSMPLSPEISHRLFSFVHIQVKVRLVKPFCKVIEGCTVTILCSQTEKK